MNEHLHFMGIGGVGMSGLARWYRAEGYEVSGCDKQRSQLTDELEAEGIKVYTGHDSEHLSGVTTLISTMAVADSEPELTAASHIRSIKRIALLAELFSKRQAIGVTGTHGKSTTTGMLTTIFLDQKDASVLLGANLPRLKGNMRYSKSPYLLAEVDESDPGFAQLKTQISVITNLENDHIAEGFSERRNYHASYADLEQAVLSFAANSKQIIYCGDWLSLERLVGQQKNAFSYGLNKYADYAITDLHLFSTGSSFTLRTPKGTLFPVKLTVPGEHNVLNATAALSAADLAGLDLAEASNSLKSYSGVGRRWQQWGNIKGALVIDDYAHHPTEIAATLKTARQTGRRVRAVLQPHRWIRTAQHWPEMADAASLADEVLVMDIYGAGETPIDNISPDLIVERINLNGKPAYYYSFEDAKDYLAETTKSNDLVITLGAGNVWQIAEGLVQRLEQKLNSEASHA
ncbi:MAG: UDP-N-acetylmuramate--L-alanine ligase [Trueperaceae bacterium]|nr:UDP-N-acetylmuramate--L-alanine ligase [Trueperaceae bacterium]